MGNDQLPISRREQRECRPVAGFSLAFDGTLERRKVGRDEALGKLGVLTATCQAAMFVVDSVRYGLAKERRESPLALQLRVSNAGERSYQSVLDDVGGVHCAVGGGAEAAVRPASQPRQ